MEKLFPEFHLLTQNIDGLHQRAGSRNVIELHGNITRTKCFNEGPIVATWEENGELPPKCPNCGGLLRPDVVWFEEPMPEKETALAFQFSASCDVFLSIGTSTWYILRLRCRLKRWSMERPSLKSIHKPRP
jgi:NAD-dependent deacetylase